MTKRNAESLLGDGPRVIGMIGPKDEQRKSSRNFEIASNDGQHATPESYVEHAQDDARMSLKREGDRGENQLKISSLRATKSAIQLHPVGVPAHASRTSKHTLH